MARITGTGTPERTWKRWYRTHSLTHRDVRGLVPEGKRLVVIAPHPDDEILGLGGTLAELSACGKPCVIFGVTNGERSHPGSRDWSRSHLKRVRSRERKEGLRRLGLSDPEVILADIPDGCVAANELLLYQRILEVITPDDVAFATWRNDGHPDHEAVGRAVARACREVGSCHFEVPIWMWHWAAPGDARVPWKALACIPLSESAVACKRAAISAHVSQLTRAPDLASPPILGRSALARCRRPWEAVFTCA